MKKMWLWCLLLVCMPMVQAHAASSLVEGIEYEHIFPEQPTKAAPGKVEVVEIFWYACPHCYRLEPKLKEWLKNKPDNVDFYRIPAQFNKNWEIHAAAFYVADSLGMVNELHDAFFHEIHEKKNPLNTVDLLASFFLRHGVSRQKFLSVYNSFAVRTRMAHAKGMVQRYGVRSVPTFIINGKYRTNVSMAGTEEELFRVINELVLREANKSKSP